MKIFVSTLFLFLYSIEFHVIWPGSFQFNDTLRQLRTDDQWQVHVITFLGSIIKYTCYQFLVVSQYTLFFFFFFYFYFYFYTKLKFYSNIIQVYICVWKLFIEDLNPVPCPPHSTFHTPQVLILVKWLSHQGCAVVLASILIWGNFHFMVHCFFWDINSSSIFRSTLI